MELQDLDLGGFICRFECDLQTSLQCDLRTSLQCDLRTLIFVCSPTKGCLTTSVMRDGENFTRDTLIWFDVCCLIYVNTYAGYLFNYLSNGDRPLLAIGFMSPQFKALTASHDLIGWRDFTEGHISTHFYAIQQSFTLLCQAAILTATVYLQDTPDHTLTMDFSEHLSPR